MTRESHADGGRILSLPRLLTEEEVAQALGCSTQTVKRERQRGHLGYTRIGRGRIRYTEDQVATYLEDQREGPCKTERAGSARSAGIGSAGAGTAQPGAGPGSTLPPDRLAAHRLAQMILTKPSSRLPRG